MSSIFLLIWLKPISLMMKTLYLLQMVANLISFSRGWYILLCFSFYRDTDLHTQPFDSIRNELYCFSLIETKYYINFKVLVHGKQRILSSQILNTKSYIAVVDKVLAVGAFKICIHPGIIELISREMSGIFYFLCNSPTSYEPWPVAK